ncbi:ATPase, AAA family protein [Tritrichomonas foetus]|uniref:ATPase, AAA family protein n=1 Tax=Tritrichomonas foetus TaxID=1144522 RepID=A0A1J4J762_9EUKA|nr:ATPase, AAA family protein [Tritrichomonas foetus]|eukprot:OHS94497.1 ATPase, AAA family protein [Tritrichomonas foetus]
MFDETNPILKNIEDARELAALGNYEACLRSYSSARDLIAFEQKNCRSRAENDKWSTIIKDIVGEEVKIRRIRKYMDDISYLLTNEEAKKMAQIEKSKELHTKPDFVLQTKVGRRSKSDNKQPGKPRRVAPFRNNIIAKPQPKPSPSPPKSYIQAQDNNEKPNTPRSKAPEIDNQLAQQIIDMGILIKEPDVDWESIAGLADIKKLLRQNLVILPMRPDIAHGLLSPWRSVLFYGPPGTGKTFLAKAIATECHRTFFNITSATITSRFHGESEKLVNYLFDLAEQMSPSTIFFDEIDALASQRGSANENEASRRVKSQLLIKLEGIDTSSKENNIFVLAATNFPWDLDEALLRRFQKRVYIPLPDFDGRKSLILMSLESLTDEKFDYDLWAEQTDGYSCADITNVCRDAAQIVFDRQTSMMNTEQWIQMPAEDAQIIVSNDDFAHALAHRMSSVDHSLLHKYEEWKSQKGAE